MIQSVPMFFDNIPFWYAETLNMEQLCEFALNIIDITNLHTIFPHIQHYQVEPCEICNRKIVNYVRYGKYINGIRIRNLKIF